MPYTVIAIRIYLFPCTVMSTGSEGQARLESYLVQSIHSAHAGSGPYRPRQATAGEPHGNQSHYLELVETAQAWGRQEHPDHSRTHGAITSRLMTVYRLSCASSPFASSLLPPNPTSAQPVSPRCKRLRELIPPPPFTPVGGSCWHYSILVWHSNRYPLMVLPRTDTSQCSMTKLHTAHPMAKRSWGHCTANVIAVVCGLTSMSVFSQISNLMWAFGTLGVRHIPLLSAIGDHMSSPGVLDTFGSQVPTPFPFAAVAALGAPGFHFRCGGGVDRAPQNSGGGVREKGSIDRHHYHY